MTIKHAALLGVALSLTGCHKDHEKVGDAPRSVTAAAPGWQAVSTSGVTLHLPKEWKFVDLTTGNLEQGMDRILGSDPKYANVRSQALTVAKQGLVKLMAFDSTTVGAGFATNCNVVVHQEPAYATLEMEADATVKQLAVMTAGGKAPEVSYVNTGGGRTALIRTQMKSPNPSVPEILSLAYICMKGSDMAAVTFTCPVSDESRIRAIADQAMGSFQFIK